MWVMNTDPKVWFISLKGGNQFKLLRVSGGPDEAQEVNLVTDESFSELTDSVTKLEVTKDSRLFALAETYAGQFSTFGNLTEHILTRGQLQ
jgi:hypothetical protein